MHTPPSTPNHDPNKVLELETPAYLRIHKFGIITNVQEHVELGGWIIRNPTSNTKTHYLTTSYNVQEGFHNGTTLR